MILNENRSITSPFIDVFSKSMGFSDEEKSFFTLIVNHGQCTSAEQKAHYLDRIFEIQGQNKDLIEIKNYHEFLSSGFLPKLLVLLSFEDIDRSCEGLSAYLKKDLSVITESLQKLQDMKLAAAEGSAWVPTKKSFKVPKQFGSTALEHYHNSSLEEAKLAQKLPADRRRFRSLLLPLSENDYQNLLVDIEALISKAVAKYDSDTLHQKRLYKMNVNLFPVTELSHKLENETRLFEMPSLKDTGFNT